MSSELGRVECHLEVTALQFPAAETPLSTWISSPGLTTSNQFTLCPPQSVNQIFSLKAVKKHEPLPWPAKPHLVGANRMNISSSNFPHCTLQHIANK
jgi:hypothetical protein